ncbi:MAG: DUF5055 domain-containing protein [Deltaproteobacteria bacterium]|nr:DUF5055 domain-containing protein [Deltaproteobacteria bacterium]
MTDFEYEGKSYELKMTRAGVRVAEEQGLCASEIAEKPFSAINWLFFASLYSRYKINPAKAATMLDALLESDGEIPATFEFTKLFEELSEAYANLFGLGGSE